jgi:predicted transposase YbfD/YdcC
MAKPCVAQEEQDSTRLICSPSVPERRQETLLQVEVSHKTNEIPIAQALLPCLPLLGRVFTSDALHTQINFHCCVHALGGYSVLTVKKNQPTLYEALSIYFADVDATYVQASTRDDHRGRTEIRTIKVSTEMNAYLAAWPHVAEARSTYTHRDGSTDWQNQPRNRLPNHGFDPCSSQPRTAAGTCAGTLEH